MDSQGDLRVYRGADGSAGQTEESHMGDLSPPGGETEQVGSKASKAVPEHQTFPSLLFVCWFL